MDTFSLERRWCDMELRVLAKITGLSEDELLLKAGLNKTEWDAHARIPQTYQHQLWCAAEKASGQKSIALDVAREIQIGDIGAVGYEMLSASNPEQALESFVRHGPLVANVLRFEIHRVSNYLKISAHVSSPSTPISHHAFDLAVAASAKLLQGPISDGSIKVYEAHFPHSGFGQRARYESLLNCRCLFKKSSAALVFELDALQHSMPAANPELHAELRAKLDQQSQHESPWTQALRDKITKLITAGLPHSRVHVAHAFGVSERSLLRRLESENTNFKSISDGCILSLGLRYLEDGWSATQVAPALGFADAASLGKAIKRISGKTIRQLKQDARTPKTPKLG